MKFICGHKQLEHGLELVGRVVARKTTMPILTNVLLEAEGNAVKLTATNLETTLSTWVEAEVESEGSFTVPAGFLHECVKTLPSLPVTLENDENAIYVTCGKATLNIKGTDAADFPPTPTVEGLHVTLQTEAFKTVLGRTSRAAARELSRPVLTGVQFLSTEYGCKITATDGFQVAMLHDNDGDWGDANLVVPVATLNEVERLLGNLKGTLEIVIGVNKVLYKISGDVPVEVVASLCMDKYPELAGLIPDQEEFNARVSMDTTALARAVRTCSYFAPNITFHGKRTEDMMGKLYLSAREEGNDIHIDIDMKISKMEEDEFTISFNKEYMQRVLDVMVSNKSSQVEFDCINSRKPGIFKMPEIDNYMYLLMPVAM